MGIVECDHAFAHFCGNATLEVVENGGQGRNRTADASLFRAALYHLSYLATGACGKKIPGKELQRNR